MKQKTEKCPFCGGVMTPIYNAVYGNRKYHTIRSWECSRAGCQFNPNYFGSQELEHRNLKKIMKMQNRITELEFDNRSLVEQMNKMAITTLAETPLAISYVFRINIPHLNIAAGIGIVFFLIFLWSGR